MMVAIQATGEETEKNEAINRFSVCWPLIPVVVFVENEAVPVTGKANPSSCPRQNPRPLRRPLPAVEFVHKEVEQLGV